MCYTVHTHWSYYSLRRALPSRFSTDGAPQVTAERVTQTYRKYRHVKAGSQARSAASFSPDEQPAYRPYWYRTRVCQTSPKPRKTAQSCYAVHVTCQVAANYRTPLSDRIFRVWRERSQRLYGTGQRLKLTVNNRLADMVLVGYRKHKLI